MKAMMQSMVGGAMPTLRSLCKGEIVSVRESANIREATEIMAKTRKSLLVMDEGELVGILGPNDILNKVVAKGKSPDLTAVMSVMTVNPICVSSDMTLLEVLKEMDEQKVLHLPVRDDRNGQIIGVVDVMQLLGTTAEGGQGWRDFFKNALENERDDVSVQSSSHQSTISNSLHKIAKPSMAGFEEFSEFDLRSSVSDSFRSSIRIKSFVFKVSDSEGNSHRIQCPVDLVLLRHAVVEKLGWEEFESSMVLKYEDDEKDLILISTDNSLADAVDWAVSHRQNSLKLIASTVMSTKKNDHAVQNGLTSFQSNLQNYFKHFLSYNNVVAIGAAVGAAAVFGITITSIIFRRTRK
jgi:CBS domain-containing protein